MNKRLGLGLLAGFLLLAAIGISEARFAYNNHSIDKDYSAEDIIKGQFNLTFENHPANAMLTSNFPGEISLIGIILKSKINEGTDYNCSVKNCGSELAAVSEIQKSFTTSMNEKKLLGFNLSGEDVNIQSVKLKVTSNSPPSCYGQIGIDLLDNYTNAFRNIKYIDEKCGVRYSECFDENGNHENAELTKNTNNPYCEKITLPAAPAYKIGAKLYNSTMNTNAPISAEIYSMDWALLGGCTLPNHTAHFEELKCIVALPKSSQEDYMVCLTAKQRVNSNYSIPTEQRTPVCGNSERGSKEYSRDYFIFGEALKYDSASLELNEENFKKATEKSLIITVNGYLEDKYNKNCRQGCSIPAPILSALGQNIEINEAEIKYSTKGTVITNNKLYSLESRNSSVNSGPISLNISEAKFTIPKNIKEAPFSLFIDGERVYLPLKINIKMSFDFDLQPKTAAIGFPTLFKIVMPDNVSSVSWNFGDGPALTSQGKNISYTPREQKKYEVEITARRDKDGVTSTKKFEVKIIGAKESSKKLIEDTEKRLVDLEKQIASYPNWVSKEIEKRINTTDTKVKLNSIKLQQNKAIKDEEHVKIIQDLLALTIPVSISSNVKGTELLIAGLATADLGFIKNISRTGYSNDEQLKKEILAWTEEKYRADAEREVISIYNGAGYTPIATKFSIKIASKGGGDSPAHLIIAIPKNRIVFEKGYGEKEIRIQGDEGVVIGISGSNTINFVVPEEVSLSSVGAYLSPNIKELVKDINVEPPPETPKRGKWATLWIIVLIVAFLAAYVMLQEWYKRKYESYLFPNKDDLYNIINFIYNARSNGLSDSEIKGKLNEAGWRGEQIIYAMKKIDGKRTGMWEIPIFKFLENRKVKQELERRQGKPLDTSFIKRPSF